MSTVDVLQAIVRGFSLGCLFGLIAVGYSLIYGSARLINFAHGEFFVLGGYYTIFFIGGTNQVPGALPLAALLGIASIGCLLGTTNFWRALPFWGGVIGVLSAGLIGFGGFLFLAERRVSIPIAVVLGGISSAIIASAAEKFVYRPMTGKSRLRYLVAALGLSFVLRGFLELTVGSERRTFTGLLSTQVASTWYREPILGSSMPRIDVLIILSTLFVTLGLWLSSRYTWLGLAIRAVGEMPEVPQNLGIDVDKVRSYVFALGGFLAGIACFMFFVRQGFLEPSLGYSQGLLAFCAAVIGGIGRVQGALIGGIVIGLVLSLFGIMDLSTAVKEILPGSVAAYLPSLNLSDWSLGVVYGVMIIVFLFRERGIVGEEQWRAL